MVLYYKMQQILLQNVTAILLQNATKAYYKMGQVFYYKLQQLYYKIWQSLQNAMFITNCDSTCPCRLMRIDAVLTGFHD